MPPWLLASGRFELNSHTAAAVISNTSNPQRRSLKTHTKPKAKHNSLTSKLSANHGAYSRTKSSMADAQHRVFANTHPSKDSFDMSAVPVPNPDTGVHSGNSPSHIDKTIFSSGTSVFYNTASSTDFLSHSLVPTQAPASLPSAAFSSATVLTIHSPVYQPTSAATISSSSIPPAHTIASYTTQATHWHIPTLAIAFITGGSVCILLAFFIIIRACTRPKRRLYPTPSLPLQDKASGDESPIFGGKERLSSQLDFNINWAAFQAAKPVQMPLDPPQASLWAGHTSDWRINNLADQKAKVSSHVAHNRHYVPGPTSVYRAHSPSRDTAAVNLVHPLPVKLSERPSVHHMQNVITNMARRISTASLNLSSRYDFSHFVAGNVSGDPTALTADGHEVMKRSSNKVALRNSKSLDVLTRKHKDLPTMSIRESQGLAYDGADVYSPTIQSWDSSRRTPTAVIAATTSVKGGRSRIKSSYYASTAYPRMSTVPQGIPASVSAKSFVFDELPDLPLHRTESQREQQTQTLASVLGLSFSSPICPPPPSPQPTLFPDDSLSMMGPRKRTLDNLTVAGDRLRVSLLSGPTQDALGSLMLGDSAASKWMITRVPSPPAMPSLAQMAMEHGDPNEYASYRSPTYSIYGLYEGNRISTRA